MKVSPNSTPRVQLRIHTDQRADDARQVERVLNGDHSTFRDLVNQYHGLCFHVAFRVLREAGDAEEVVQDAFVKVHGALEEFRGEASLKTWILRIVWRLSLNRQRDRARSSWVRLGLNADGEATVASRHGRCTQHPDALYQAGDTKRQILQLIDELPEPLRQALVLHGFDELSYDDVARILLVPVGTVCSRIHSARRKLAAGMQRKGLL